VSVQASAYLLLFNCVNFSYTCPQLLPTAHFLWYSSPVFTFRPRSFFSFFLSHSLLCGAITLVWISATILPPIASAHLHYAATVCCGCRCTLRHTSARRRYCTQRRALMCRRNRRTLLADAHYGVQSVVEVVIRICGVRFHGRL
jgi:hypothetical protein